MTPVDGSHSEDLRFGFRRFQAAFWISMFAVSVQFLLFLVPGIIHRRWEGELGGYFVVPAFLISCGIIVGGGIIWILGFKILRFASRLIYLVLARNRVGYVDWDRVFCRSLWPLPWAFGIGAVVYVAYFAAGCGGWPDDVIVGTIGNLLGAFCYGTLFYHWYRLCQKSPQGEIDQTGDGEDGRCGQSNGTSRHRCSPLKLREEMIPQSVYGNPVRFYAEIDEPRFPRGYPGDGGLEPTAAFLISVSDEGIADDERFWVSCLGKSGRIMAGGMCYSLETAMNFPASEFDLPPLNWREVAVPSQS